MFFPLIIIMDEDLYVKDGLIFGNAEVWVYLGRWWIWSSWVSYHL